MLQEDRQEELNQALLVLMDGWWIDRMCGVSVVLVLVRVWVWVVGWFFACVLVVCVFVCMGLSGCLGVARSVCVRERAYSLVCPSVFLQCVCLSVLCSCICFYVLTNSHLSIHASMHLCLPTHIASCLHEHLHTYTNTYTNTYTHTNTHTHVHACTGCGFEVDQDHLLGGICTWAAGGASWGR